ncbi:MAG: SRPBCC family protein [Vicinamibacterales bacterium]
MRAHVPPFSRNDYHFVTTWRVRAASGEVADVLREPLELVRWWPSVYLEAEEIAPPDSQRLGQQVRLRTKGWLPYTLNWTFTVVENDYPRRFAIDARGDFAGRGVWTIEQDGTFVNATFDWQVTAEKPLLRMLSPALRPLLEANHRWAMAQGEASLLLEIERRRAGSAAARGAVPPPPGPVTYAAAGLIAGGVAVAGTLAYLVCRAAGRRR